MSATSNHGINRDSDHVWVAPMRAPEEVMTLARMGAAFPTRLSFMRQLVHRMCNERWSVSQTDNSLDASGYGTMLWRAQGPQRAYTLVCFSHFLEPEERTDRVIAEAWDATFVLYDGVPTPSEVERLRLNAPKQEAGRYRSSDLVLARANRSVRLFEHVTTRLAQGVQPRSEVIEQIGYLMRTTAVYGNGKFGIADRLKFAPREELGGPFSAEMLTVYLIRCFSVALAEHIAAQMATGAATLDRALKRALGVGNATGLGMAPFLASHPRLIHRWFEAKERALANARSATRTSLPDPERVVALFERAATHIAQWQVDDARQMAKIQNLRKEWRAVCERVSHLFDAQDSTPPRYPFEALFQWQLNARQSLEAEELLVAAMIECTGKSAIPHAIQLSDSTWSRLDTRQPLAELQTHIESHYRWALDIDFSNPRARQRFWYVSEEKAEPRIGDRFEEPGAEKELPLAIAQEVQQLHRCLKSYLGAQTPPSLPEFLLAHPGQRAIVQRIQYIGALRYAEIRANLIAADTLPIDMLRCKLAFFGASKFDPKSDLWTRITLYQGAPVPEELAPGGDDWAFAICPSHER